MTDDLILPAFDERIVRRAMVRGVVSTGLFAALALMLMLVLVGVASFAVSGVRGDNFFLVAYQGMIAAHPEYDMKQDGNCCTAGPLFGFTNLGLASELKLEARPWGALNHAGSSTITVEQDAFGDLHTNVDSQGTPLVDGFRRGRPTKEATGAFLADLPEMTIVSALVEFDHPTTPEVFAAFFETAVPVEYLPDRRVPVIVVPPYESRSGYPLGWPNARLEGLREWADQLGGIDEEHLKVVGLPSAAEIQAAALEGRIHAFVIPRMPVSLAKAVLANGSVRSANILDVAFDPDRQTSRFP
jgi:hypothetical protein